MGIQINGNTDNISATDGGLTVSDLEINQSGISTFNGNIDANGDLDVDGHTELDNVNISGVSTYAGQARFNGELVGSIISVQNSINISDQLIHSGDTNTKIRFPAADTITAETNGSERVRITSDGKIGIGNNNPSYPLVLTYTDNTTYSSSNFIANGLQIENTSTTDNTASGIFFTAKGSGANAGAAHINCIRTANGSGTLTFSTRHNVGSHTERLRISSAGDIGMGVASPSARLHVSGGNGLLVERSAGTSIAGFKHSGASAMNIYFQNTGSTNHPYIGSSNQDLTLGTNNLERLRITSGGDTTINGDLTVSSGTSGDAKLIIEADTDNNDEGDNPTLVFKQDGGIEVSSIGHGLLSGDQNGLVIANSCSNGYISLATGTTNGHTNATERLRINDAGKFCLGTYNSNFASNDGIVSIVNAAGAGTENTLLTLWNTTTVADARAGIDFLTNAHYGTGRDGAFIRGSNDGVTAKAHLQFGTIKDETYTENFRISSDGNVQKPNSCCFQAVINSGTHPTSGSYLVFGSVDVNIGNYYNSSNGIFTAPVAGTYLFHISAIAHNNSATVYRYYLRINNGNTGSGNDAHLRLDRANNGAGAAYGPNASFTYYKYMNVNDTARVWWHKDSGSGTSYSNADYMKFAGHLVG